MSLIPYSTCISLIMLDTVRNLDFANIKATEGIYGIHEYPAMLHYRVVRELIERFGKDKKVLLDPFCGTGVSLCEALRKGKKAIGVDINPLALLIAKVRCSKPIEVPVERILKETVLATADVPPVKNLEYWFKEDVVEKLGKLRATIKKFREEKFYELLLVAFSQTVRLVSNNKKGEFKRFRMKEDELKKHSPDVFDVFEKVLRDYTERLRTEPVLKDDLTENLLELYRKDIREGLFLKEKVDLVISSPPYGDSKTTVAYEQFVSFSLDWLQGLNPFGDASMKELSKQSLGSSGGLLKDLSFSKTFTKTLSKLETLSEKRAREVYSFFSDLFVAFCEMDKLLEKDAVVCLVVGNRKVAGITVLMDEIVKEMFEHLGYVYVGTFMRQIHNKRMPLLNSPSNKAGQKDNTMRHEYVVVVRKLF